MEDATHYVIATMRGPFGDIRQVSAPMRASEAAMTAGWLSNPRAGKKEFNILHVVVARREENEKVVPLSRKRNGGR